MRKWQCSVCGYVHTGDEPPEKCPVCGADKSQFVEITDPAEAPAEPEPESKPITGAAPDEPSAPPPPASPLAVDEPEGRLGERLDRLHAHPISVHIPNGVLPVAVGFAVLALITGCRVLETAALCNTVIVFLAMPAVLFTGYMSWRHKYKGARTDLFLTKLACGAGVTILTLFLSLWWMVDPQVITTPGAGRWIFILINLAALALAVIAGLMGGRLVFRDR